MKRLTTNKPVNKMSMLELAHNSCYAKDGKARYRDYDLDTDARDFARNIMGLQAGIELPKNDEEFDDVMLNYLLCDPAMDVIGTIALLYRNLWAMADLRETLKDYEDKQEKGLLLELPCKIGDTVFIWECCDCVSVARDWETGIPECPFENDCEFEECEEGSERLFKTSVTSIWNNGRGWYFSVRGLCLEVSISAIGRTVFLTEAEAKEALEEAEVSP